MIRSSTCSPYWQSDTVWNTRLSYRRGTARRFMWVETLSTCVRLYTVNRSRDVVLRNTLCNSHVLFDYLHSFVHVSC